MNKLDLVVWEITDQCNLNCSHCYKNYLGKKTYHFTSSNTIPRVCASLRALNTKTLIISGGEPLLDLQMILAILRELKSDNIETVLTTNGTLLSQSTINQLKEHHLTAIQISIDGATKDAHEKIRGCGTYEKAMRAIEMCVASKLPVIMMTVPNTDTIKDLVVLAKTAAQLGVSKFGIERPFPCSSKYNKQFYFSSADLSRLHDMILQIEDLNILPIHCNDPIYTIRKLVDRNIPAEMLLNTPDFCPGGCSGGIRSAVISANGAIRPCTFSNEVVGSLTEQSLETIWYTSITLANIRKRVPRTGKCASCSYFSLCRGCFAQTIALGLRRDESDISCYL